MTYPSEWMASTEPGVESGTATFTVDGLKYTLRLECFEDFMAIGNMLDATFKQGKSFAAVAMRGHIERSLEEAARIHDL